MPPKHDHAALSRAKSIACRKCHERKVKCPGGRPCQTCVQLKCEPDCIYPKRDRQIKVNQSYIDGLVEENRQLRAQLQGSRSTESNTPQPPEDDSTLGVQDGASVDGPNQNPLLHDKPWFLPLKPFNVPIYIGEAADAAFATRFRQVMSGTTLNHIPRISYPGIDQIEALAVSTYTRPSSTQARFLLRSALTNIGECYHIVRKSREWDLLDRFLRAPETLDSLSECKILALFALGELHSSPSGAGPARVPGLVYFSHATRAQCRLFERPSVERIEVDLLLCLYSLCINRRHSAYFLASSAIRHCAVMGVHLNLPESQGIDAVAREHLIRVWWTSYIFDQTCAIANGNVVSVSDDEILTDLPSNKMIGEADQEDFKGTESMVSRIHLAKLTSSIMKSLYGRTKQTEPFLQRVQLALKNLKGWVTAFSESLSMGNHTPASLPQGASLHLVVNQCMILATRPVLLHVLSIHKESTLNGNSNEKVRISDSMRALADACTQCARNSYAIICDFWIEGFFKTFDSFKTRYLFSCATVLAISGLVSGSDSGSDRADFDFAGELLERLRDSGSFTAMDFCLHIDAIRLEMADLALQGGSGSATADLDRLDVLRDPGNTPQRAPDWLTGMHGMTAEAALAEPSLEAFLAQNEPTPGKMDEFLDDTQLEDLYWPAFGNM